MKYLRIKPRKDKEYCGHCGKLIEGVPQFGVGLHELPFMLYGELVHDGNGADIIKAGGLLIIPFCSEACREIYVRDTGGKELYTQDIDDEMEENALLDA